jgi:hypothetical protein
LFFFFFLLYFFFFFFFLFFFFFFFFFLLLLLEGPGGYRPRNVLQPAGLLYFPYAFEVPTYTARRPHVYNDARDL